MQIKNILRWRKFSKKFESPKWHKPCKYMSEDIKRVTLNQICGSIFSSLAMGILHQPSGHPYIMEPSLRNIYNFAWEFWFISDRESCALVRRWPFLHSPHSGATLRERYMPPETQLPFQLRRQNCPGNAHFKTFFTKQLEQIHDFNAANK